jgi:hypothetical protein
MANFELFHRSLLPLKSEPTVTIRRRGMLSLNASAFAALGSPDSVELLYDADLRMMGMRAVDPRSETAYRVRPPSSGPGPYLVSATTFLRFHGLETGGSVRWPGYLSDGVLCVDLTAEGTPVTSNRAQTGRSGD